jgi:hypothetical protein
MTAAATVATTLDATTTTLVRGSYNTIIIANKYNTIKTHIKMFFILVFCDILLFLLFLVYFI